MFQRFIRFSTITEFTKFQLFCVTVSQLVNVFNSCRYVVFGMFVINILIYGMMKNPHFVPVSSW